MEKPMRRVLIGIAIALLPITGSADPFISTLPVTIIPSQGIYTVEVTNTTNETLAVDFTLGAYLFGADSPGGRPHTIAPGAIANYLYTPNGGPPGGGEP